MTVRPDSVIVQEDEPVAAEVDGEVVMLSERAGAYFGLDGIGSEIWRLIGEPRRVSDLCQSLAQRYDVDGETLTRDVSPSSTSCLRAGSRASWTSPPGRGDET